MLSPEEVAERKEALAKRRETKRRLHRRRMIALVVLLVLGLVLMAVAGFVSYRQGTVTTLASQVDSSSQRIYVLFIGVDQASQSATRADTLMVAAVDPGTGQVGVLSIPRDTRVFIPERNRWDRINAAYAIGGANLTLRAVSRLLDLPIDYYVKTDFDGFRQLIDTLGGVEIDVENRMQYVDNAQGLFIDLQPGRQRLDGDQALQYVRFRDRLGDVSLVDPRFQTYDGRVERQRRFVIAVSREMLQPRTIPKIPKLIPQIWNLIDTNLSFDVVVRFSVSATRFSSDTMQSGVLPGTAGQVNGAAYWIVDEERKTKMVTTLLQGRPLPLRAETLNGSGIAGSAGAAGEVLREHGFDVLRVSNADHFNYPQTRFLVYRQEHVPRVAKMAELFDAEVVVKEADNPRVDLTVIIGRNFKR